MSMRLGFACVWDPDPRRTWSHTPWELRAALRRRPDDVEVLDAGLTLPRMGRNALRLAALRRRSGRWVTPWEHLPTWERWSERHIDRRAEHLGCDAVLQIQDLGATRVPYFLYQDLSYDVILSLLDERTDGLRLYFPHLDRATVMRRRDRQLRIYERAAGVLTMSRFLAESLVEVTGLDAARVHAVTPGAAATAPPSPPARPCGPVEVPSPARRRVDGPRRRLLFVGTTFFVKAGDTVVAALEHLRRELDPAITLTIAGPDEWPMPGGIPEGVRFVGRVDAADVGELYDSHDLLVVPSRLEGFGKVFVEALAHGVPCIGRDAFAMPELIRPGENGDLVRTEDPIELASRIAGVLADDHIFVRTADEAPGVRSSHTWDRAAADIVDLVERTLTATAPGTARPVPVL